jgi:hypothetical protein
MDEIKNETFMHGKHLPTLISASNVPRSYIEFNAGSSAMIADLSSTSICCKTV